ASNCRRPERRSQVFLSCAHPHLLPAVRADGSLGTVDHDTDRFPLPEVDDANVDARLQTLRIQVLEEAGLVLELIGDPFDRRGGAGRHALKRLGWARRHAGHRVAVRARLRVAEHLLDALLHFRRHRVLEALGLFVGLPPLEAEHFDEEPLGEAMSPNDRVRVTLPGRGQMHFFTVVQRDEALPLQAMDHLRNRRRGEAQELGEASRTDVAALLAERVERLAVRLYGGRRAVWWPPSMAID